MRNREMEGHPFISCFCILQGSAVLFSDEPALLNEPAQIDIAGIGTYNEEESPELFRSGVSGGPGRNRKPVTRVSGTEKTLKTGNEKLSGSAELQ